MNVISSYIDKKLLFRFTCLVSVKKLTGERVGFFLQRSILAGKKEREKRGEHGHPEVRPQMMVSKLDTQLLEPIQGW